ncbi:CAH14-like protein [Mya arenaria]|uniref:CAH14-like protein n=1 Tax=Mya arenaria TaxID=6604 RepID=A0ABY7F3V9_MYAAR|nr:CAH14-like protein [Mya arenaria]
MLTDGWHEMCGHTEGRKRKLRFLNVRVGVFAGPDNWHLGYPHCGGVKQSPIDVQTGDVVVDPNHLVPIVFSGYDNVANTNYTLGNNGHTGTLPPTSQCYSCEEQRTHMYAPYSAQMLYMRGTTDTQVRSYSIPMLYMRGTTDTQVRSLLHPNAIHAGNNGHTGTLPTPSQCYTCGE